MRHLLLVVTALLVMLTAPSADAAKPRYGIYITTQVRTLALDPETGRPLASELRTVGRHNFLYTDSRGQVSEWRATYHSRPRRQVWLYSVDNANQRYHLTAVLPPERRSYAINMGTAFIVSTGNGNDGKTFTYTFRLNRQQADRAAVIFGVPRKDRSDLGKQLKVAFSVSATRVGEPVVVKATITNIGTTPVVVPTGGAYRGSGRNNRFSLEASYDGRPLKDIGRSMNLGGLGGIPVLGPGKSQTVQAVVDKWFKLTAPGTYELQVTYDLQAQLPRPPVDKEALWPAYAHEYWEAPRSGTVKFHLAPTAARTS